MIPDTFPIDTDKDSDMTDSPLTDRQTVAAGYGAGRSNVGRVTGWPTGTVRSSGRTHLADCACRSCDPERHAHGVTCACDRCHGTDTATAYQPVGGPTDRVTSGDIGSIADDADTVTTDGVTLADWHTGVRTLQGREGERSALVVWVPDGHGPDGDALGTVPTVGNRGSASTDRRCRCQLCAPKARGRTQLRTNKGHRVEYNATANPTPDRGRILAYTVPAETLAVWLTVGVGVQPLGPLGAGRYQVPADRTDTVPGRKSVAAPAFTYRTPAETLADIRAGRMPARATLTLTDRHVAPMASRIPLATFADTVTTLTKSGAEPKTVGRKSKGNRRTVAADTVAAMVDVDSLATDSDTVAAMLAMMGKR